MQVIIVKTSNNTKNHKCIHSIQCECQIPKFHAFSAYIQAHSQSTLLALFYFDVSNVNIPCLPILLLLLVLFLSCRTICDALWNCTWNRHFRVQITTAIHRRAVTFFLSTSMKILYSPYCALYLGAHMWCALSQQSIYKQLVMEFFFRLFFYTALSLACYCINFTSVAL